MSETPNAPAGEQPTPQPSDTGMIPKARFDEVIQQRNEMRERLSALEEAEKGRQQADLEKRGEWDTLKQQYEADLNKLREENAALSTSSTKLAEIQKAQREAQIAELPEDRREFAGSLNDEQLAVYVKTHAKKTPHFASDKPGGGTHQATSHAEIAKLTPSERAAAHKARIAELQSKL